MDEAKTPTQSDGLVETDVPSSAPSTSPSQILKMEPIADSVRDFLKTRQVDIPDNTGVVFDNISVVGSGTGVSAKLSFRHAEPTSLLRLTVHSHKVHLP
jgi:hypothetical protein